MVDADVYNIDYSAGNGAQSERGAEWDAEAPIEHDGRSITRTGFNPRDADSDYRVDRHGETYSNWEWLSTLNEDYRAVDADEQKSRAEVRRDAQTFANQLGMTPHQRERVCHIIDSLESLSFGSIPVEGTVLAIISLVANEDDWWIQQVSEDESDNRGPNVEVTKGHLTKEMAMFTKLMADCNVSPKAIRTVRKELDSSPRSSQNGVEECKIISDVGERIEKLEEPWKDGDVLHTLNESDLSLREIGGLLDCGVPTVCKWMRDYGLDEQKSASPIRSGDDVISFEDDGAEQVTV